MTRSAVLLLLAVGLSNVGTLVPAVAQDAPAACRPNQTDRVARPAPDALLPVLARTFGVAPDGLSGGSYVRCAHGRLMGCMVGANLECGPADVSRRSPGATSFCRDNPNVDTVPMAATGHATVYDWRCVGRRAVAGRRSVEVDPLGFIAVNWRPLH
jgi:hypothetical protein